MIMAHLITTAFLVASVSHGDTPTQSIGLFEFEEEAARQFAKCKVAPLPNSLEVSFLSTLTSLAWAPLADVAAYGFT